MSTSNHRRGPRLLAAMLLAATLATGAAVWHGQTVAEDKTTPPVAQTPEHQQEKAFAKSLSHAFRIAANTTLPSVVTITSEVASPPARGNQNPARRRKPVQGDAVRRLLQ